MAKILIRQIDGLLQIRAFVFSKGYHAGLIPISFFVDTGSDASFISHDDAMNMQIPLDSLSLRESFSMGSGKYNLAFGRPATLYFKTDEGKILQINIPAIPVGLSTKKGNKREQEIGEIPSILGTDFLMENSLGLHFFPRKDEAWLEQ